MNNIYSFEGAEGVPSPQLVFYPELIRQNVRHMIEMAGSADRLWPHVKTHKSRDVLRIQLEEGITRFKSATIAEAEMCAKEKAEHVCLAYPLVGPNIGRFLRLTAAFPETCFYAIADDDGAVRQLSKAAHSAGRNVYLLMDFDMGQHRTGVAPDKAEELFKKWSALPGIIMRGMHCYDGHRHESDPEIRAELVKKSDDIAISVKERLIADGLDCSILIMGGTPSFPVHAEYTKEYLSPGTCVLQDFGYRDAYRDIVFTPAATVLTRVVSRPSEDTFTLDLGTKAIASDPPIPRAEIVGFEDAETVLQNEEHLVLRVKAERIKDIPAIGAELFAIPTHVCPTSALYPEAAVAENGKFTGFWPITARNRKITY